jgi:hypothetical protein
VQLAKLFMNLRPYVMKWLAQDLRMAIAKQGGIGVIVKHDQLGSPSHGHRETGVEDHVQD